MNLIIINVIPYYNWSTRFRFYHLKLGNHYHLNHFHLHHICCISCLNKVHYHLFRWTGYLHMMHHYSIIIVILHVPDLTYQITCFIICIIQNGIFKAIKWDAKVPDPLLPSSTYHVVKSELLLSFSKTIFQANKFL